MGFKASGNYGEFSYYLEQDNASLVTGVQSMMWADIQVDKELKNIPEGFFLLIVSIFLVIYKSRLWLYESKDKIIEREIIIKYEINV